MRRIGIVPLALAVSAFFTIVTAPALAGPRAGKAKPECTITGTKHADDKLKGTSGADVICAGRGADVIYGYGGDDIIFAGPGGDIVVGGAATTRSTARPAETSPFRAGRAATSSTGARVGMISAAATDETGWSAAREAISACLPSTTTPETGSSVVPGATRPTWIPAII